jgi:hypothetical protein
VLFHTFKISGEYGPMTDAKVLSINGLVMPRDFPASTFEAIQQKLETVRQQAGHSQFIGAWNAVSYRFKACTEYDKSFTASIANHGPAPGQPMRYQQERDLFGFFGSGISVFDAFYFGMFAIGTLVLPPNFPLSTTDDEKRVHPQSTIKAYLQSFPGDPFVSVLDAIIEDQAFKELRDIRNVLTHRAAPPRALGLAVGAGASIPRARTAHHISIEINAGTTSSRRKEIARLLSKALEAAHEFVAARF